MSTNDRAGHARTHTLAETVEGLYKQETVVETRIPLLLLWGMSNIKLLKEMNKGD